VNAASVYVSQVRGCPPSRILPFPPSQVLNLPLLRSLQEGIAAEFSAAYTAVLGLPEATALLRQHAVACRDLERRISAAMDSFHLTTVSVQGVLGEVRAAVEAGDMDLARALFHKVAEWVVQVWRGVGVAAAWRVRARGGPPVARALLRFVCGEGGEGGGGCYSLRAYYPRVFVPSCGALHCDCVCVRVWCFACVCVCVVLVCGFLPVCACAPAAVCFIAGDEGAHSCAPPLN
jgi:hypothetical protein